MRQLVRPRLKSGSRRSLPQLAVERRQHDVLANRVPPCERARIQVHDHSRFATTMPATVRLPRVRTEGLLAPNRRPLHAMVPLFLSVSSRSSRDRASGTIRATVRPCSVTTIVAPIFTSRTHALSFALSSRMPTLRSFNNPPARLHSTACGHIGSLLAHEPRRESFNRSSWHRTMRST